MANHMDGLYSVAAVGIAGFSAAVLRFPEGRIEGNDTAGSRYSGSYRLSGADTVDVNIEITSPPGTFGVFGIAPGETFRTLSDHVSLPTDLFLAGKPYSLPSYGIALVAARIPDSYQPLTGADGIRAMVSQLEAADRAWRSRGM